MTPARRRLGRGVGLGRRLELADIQGNVLRPYDYPFGGHLFFAVGGLTARAVRETGAAAAAGEWLGRLAAQVTTAERWPAAKPTTTLNVALTYAGLAALRVPAEWLATFPQEFREGMAARAAILGDAGASRPQTWDAGYGTGQSHVLVSMHGLDNDSLVRALSRLEAEAQRAGMGVVARQATGKLPLVREHFGFKDGFGQPAVPGGPKQPAAEGTPAWFGLTLPLPAGEFVLGYPDADGEVDTTLPRPFGRNGTFGVFRKLHQDVAGFRRWLTATADSLSVAEEWLAAKLVGRWRDGTPLALSPDRPDPAIANHDRRINDFGYAGDPDGLRCPIGAHIRRVNPRDALGHQGKMTVRHRIIRRGMPYGSALPDGDPDDGQPRGLVFVCFNASIDRQFEFLQARWCNDGDAFGLGNDRDPLVGGAGRSGKFTINGVPPRFVSPPANLVTVRGGEYLFFPGVAGLRALAEEARARPGP